MPLSRSSLKIPSVSVITGSFAQAAVIDRIKSTPDYHILMLNKPAGFDFVAGQWVEIWPVDMPADEARIFSIASSPSEPYIALLVKNGPSPYKQGLLALRPGDLVAVSEPRGGFSFRSDSPSVFVAAGMGVAPFRSMIHAILATHSMYPIRFFQISPSADAPFANEFAGFAEQENRFSYELLAETNKRARLRSLIKHHAYQSPRPDTVYYSAGPPEFITDLHALLTQQGIDSEQFVTEAVTVPKVA